MHFYKALMKKKLFLTITLLFMVLLSGCFYNKNQKNMNSSCLTKESFEKVSNKIIFDPSITIFKIEENSWEIRFELNNGKVSRLLFLKDNWTVGGITSELNVYSTAKRKVDNERLKKEIKKVFCTVYESLK
ncbi:hypothetical protein VAMP_2n629 [Candidatus Vampirococcus lugosii]|uniref:Lipoprotein n=2 Tax=Candidatus Vampirococcus lugosii TaxID=2789015 RepID=A0ABS5QJY3_9BACT|nr:hypothetical protein [Candidatus Vampirococcus lugosii]